MTMWNENYHPLDGDLLKNILDNASEEEKKIIMRQVRAATAGKIRNYRITIVPPDVEGKGGTWYDITNGIVTGSSREA